MTNVPRFAKISAGQTQLRANPDLQSGNTTNHNDDIMLKIFKEMLEASVCQLYCFASKHGSGVAVGVVVRKQLLDSGAG